MTGRERIQAFLFAPIDVRAVTWMRIGLGVAVPWLFFSLGRVPPEGLPPGETKLYEDLFLTRGYLVGVAALGGALALGLRPRLAAGLLFVLLQPLATLPGSVPSRQIVLFCLLAFVFVRSGARAGPAWPIRLLQIQLSVLYGINAIAKCHPAYLRGDVLVAMSVARDNFLVDLSTGFLALGPFAVPVALCAVGTVAIEGFLAVAFWLPRLRWLAAATGLAFHAGLTQVVQIYHLDAASILLYGAFLLPDLARQAARSAARSEA